MSRELFLIAALILVNGFFAAVEMALVMSRRHRLHNLLKQGKKSAQAVLQVKERPGNYLATVQVGITLVSTLTSAFGGITAGPFLADWLRQFPVLAPYADQLALLMIVITITYLSLVFGELVPKQLAMRNPERLSIALVRPIQWLGRIAALPIRFLSFSTDLIIGLIGPAASRGPSTSSEEIELLVQQGTAEGIFQISEGAFVSGVFEFGDRKAHDVMTSRTEMVALDAALNPKDALTAAAKSNLSRFPIFENDLDNIIGYVHLKDLIWAEENASLKEIARQILFIPESAPLPDIYRQLTQQRVHQAIVLDEHGGTAGLLTLEDVLEVIVGEIDDEYHLSQAELRQLGEKTWLAAGNIPLTQLAESIGANLRPTADYSTCAGLILAKLGHIPVVGETFSHNGISFTVRAMDNLRIDRVLVQKIN
ncbi:MAG: hemolysin family protein [Chloroflexi bacterium]|nr:hemolysin family protein [Chloroflexota bacterium]